MNAVSSLDRRRTAREAEQVAATARGAVSCACGSEWFEMRGPDGQAPAVTLDTDGRITGYAGSFTCAQCGRAGG